MERDDFKVLCVDDNENFLYLLKENLSREGFDVESFLNPYEALDYIRSDGKRNYIIFSDYDYKIHEMYGDSFLKEAKELLGDNLKKAVLITAYNKEHISYEKMPNWIQYAQKPVKSETLLNYLIH